MSEGTVGADVQVYTQCPFLCSLVQGCIISNDLDTRCKGSKCRGSSAALDYRTNFG